MSPSYAGDRLPNIVLIMTDDQGYGDVGCYGATNVRTLHMDSLAKDGTRFTSFYVSQPVCTASRASLLTGCYANRVGFAGALNPTSLNGIHERELLLSELLKKKGYATAIFGKWHLGYPFSIQSTEPWFRRVFRASVLQRQQQRLSPDHQNISATTAVRWIRHCGSRSRSVTVHPPIHGARS